MNVTFARPKLNITSVAQTQRNNTEIRTKSASQLLHYFNELDNFTYDQIRFSLKILYAMEKHVKIN